MEKVHCICVMHNLFNALSELETNLQNEYGLSLNEAMVLCCIGEDQVPASTIAHNTGLLASHTSKTIRTIEQKALIKRNLGKEDKRQMFFKLTPRGREILERLQLNGIKVPELLQSLF